jgi:hypothetical protein
MKTLKIEDISFEAIAHEETTPIEGNAMASGDDASDKRTEKMIYRQLENGNEWAWCTIEVKGTYKGLEASDYLGCCSYKSEKDFKKDGYYKDMQQTVFEDIQKQLEDILKDHCS